MPWRLLLGAGISLATAGYGIMKGLNANANYREANSLVEQACQLYTNARQRLETQRGLVKNQLDSLAELKLTCWTNAITRYVEVFQHFKRIEFSDTPELERCSLNRILPTHATMRNIALVSNQSAGLLQSGLYGAAAGAVTGLATAGAVTSIAGMSASATLTWLGGGAAVGGMGATGGAMVFGGIVLGPALAVAGSIYNAKSQESLAEAKLKYSEVTLAVEQMTAATEVMSKLTRIAKNYDDFIRRFGQYYMNIIRQVEEVYENAYDTQSGSLAYRIVNFFSGGNNVSYEKLSQRERRTLHISWLMTQIMYEVLTAPIVTEELLIDANAEKFLETATRQSKKLLLEGHVR